MEHLTQEEKSFLKKLDTPIALQNFLDSIPFNHEEKGETCMSPRRVMREKKAHCLEGAMFAYTVLLLQKRTPLLVNLKVSPTDYDHVITLYKEHGYWGAISKTNHAVLGFRDPVYRTVRELVMSYFHEYFLIKTGEKTLLGYSRPFSMSRFGTAWETEEKDLWTIAEAIYDMTCFPTIPKGNEKYLRIATKLERKSADIEAWEK